MSRPQQPKFMMLSLALARQVALDACVSEKTVRRFIVGLPTRPAGRDRILAALASRGVDLSRLRPSRDLDANEEEPEDSPRIRQLLADAERAHADAAALGVDTSAPPAPVGKGA